MYIFSAVFFILSYFIGYMVGVYTSSKTYATDKNGQIKVSTNIGFKKYAAKVTFNEIAVIHNQSRM